MKRRIIILMLAVLCLLSGCAKQQEGQKAAVPTVQVARSAYYYDQGYVQAEGWMYDMTLSSAQQIAQLNKLCDVLILNVSSEEFVVEQGYRLIWRNAAGSVEKEMLVLSADRISMQGVMFEAEGAQGLIDWLDALRLDEQSVSE